MEKEQTLAETDTPKAPKLYGAASVLTIPSAVLVGIMAEVLSQDPLTRPDLPLPLFLAWFLGAWILFTAVAGWIATRYWKQVFSLTGYIYAVTAFITLVTVVPKPSEVSGWWGEQLGWTMIGFLAITGLTALILATTSLMRADIAAQRSQGPPPPSPTLRERFKKRAERFARTNRP